MSNLTIECENCRSEKKVDFRKPVGKSLCLKCWKADISERARKRYWEQHDNPLTDVERVIVEAFGEKGERKKKTMEDIVKEVIEESRKSPY